RHVKKHLYSVFAILGVPNTIKADNGPAHVSKSLQTAFNQWGIQHIAGIPHSPTGHAIIEQAHQV
ncbi:POK25 protein, partial [Ceuthmochares aereus]|nr:POK25 protein [Ceuthmochares aereus]